MTKQEMTDTKDARKRLENEIEELRGQRRGEYNRIKHINKLMCDVYDLIELLDDLKFIENSLNNPTIETCNIEAFEEDRRRVIEKLQENGLLLDDILVLGCTKEWEK